MGTIKDKNGRDLVDAEEIKRRWRECMEELYEKDLNEPDNYDGVVSYRVRNSGEQSQMDFRKHCC